jgi:hypothetical protein
MQMKLFEKHRALPNLAENIKCGNSLIGSDLFTGRLIADPDEMKRVNPFDWTREFPAAMKAGGFDCVIGNPPYIRMEAFAAIKQYLKERYAAHEERADFYTYFIEKGIKLIRHSGCLGMIVSNKFAVAKYGRPLRETLKSMTDVTHIVDLAGARVFRGATVRTFVLLLIPRGAVTASHTHIHYAPVPTPDEFQQIEAGVVSLSDYVARSEKRLAKNQLSAEPWQLVPAERSRLLQRLCETYPSLVTAYGWRPLFGIKTGLNEAFVIDEEKRSELVKADRGCDEAIRPFLMGRDVRRYFVRDERRFVIYLHPDRRISDYPSIRRHLEWFRVALASRAAQQEWYELQQPAISLIPLLVRPKIVYPIIAPEPRFALDTKGFLINDKLFVLPTDSRYLLGLLNSSVGRLFFTSVCARLEGSGACYYEFRAQFVERFPVRVIDPRSSTEHAMHDRIVSLVASMSALRSQLADVVSDAKAATFRRQIDASDAEIDRLVYELYGLTDEEIAIVEGDGP